MSCFGKGKSVQPARKHLGIVDAVTPPKGEGGFQATPSDTPLLPPRHGPLPVAGDRSVGLHRDVFGGNAPHSQDGKEKEARARVHRKPEEKARFGRPHCGVLAVETREMRNKVCGGKRAAAEIAVLLDFAATL